MHTQTRLHHGGVTRHVGPPRHVRIAAHAELISLVVMLANLFTVHLEPVSSLMGPTHGCAYLFVVIATWRLEEATTAAKLLAVVPGAGGLLALRRLGTAEPGRAQPKEVIPS
ncbi:DUF3817 domain-containing protein [Streptomyces sp. RM1]|uniref:DUF3817 domain-containing protein n=1 Tax=Streptomyces misionensis TaxID=67331 RepID=UPI00396B93BF